MRICILSQSRLEVPGGVESYINSLSAWLIAGGNDVVVISRGLYTLKSSPNVGTKGYRALRVPQFIYMAGLLLSSFMAIQRVLKENRIKRIDVIHAVDSGYAGLAGIIVSRLTGVPLCYSVHSHRRFLLGRYFKGILGWLMASFDFGVERLVYQASDKIVVLDENLRKYVLSFGFKLEKIIEVPVAVDISKFMSARGDSLGRHLSLGIEEDSLIIGYVGRLEKEKNLFTLVRAFRGLLQIKGDVYLLLIGDGSLIGSLREFVKDAKMAENVRFLGSRSDIPVWLSMFDVFVLPSFTEGMSIALLEAMASGKAIVASNIAGIARMVKDQDTALLFDPFSADQLMDKLLLLSNDSKLRQELGFRAQNYAMQYNFDLVFSKMLATYEALQRGTNV